MTTSYLKQGTMLKLLIMNLFMLINLALYYAFNVTFHQFLIIIFAVFILFNKLLKNNQLFDSLNQKLFKSIEQYKQNQPIVLNKKQYFFDEEIFEEYVYIKINQFLQDVKFIVNKLNDLMTQFLIKLTIVFFLIQIQSFIAANWLFVNFVFIIFHLTPGSIESLKDFFKLQKHYDFFTISVIDSSQIKNLSTIHKKVNETQNKEKQNSYETEPQIKNVSQVKNDNVSQPQHISFENMKNEIMKQEVADSQVKQQSVQNSVLKKSVKKQLFIQIPNVIKEQQNSKNQGKGLFSRTQKKLK